MPNSEVVGRQRLTVGSTAVGFTLPSCKRLDYAVCKVEGSDIRLLEDGTTPTATSGYPYDIGDEFKVGNRDDYYALYNFKAISRHGTNAYLEIVYYGEN